MELLVKAVDHIHSDSDKDRRGSYKKGYIVEVRESGHLYGAKEGPPKFVVVKCPEVTRAQAYTYMRQWMTDIDYEIIAADANTATYQVKAYCTEPSVSGANVLTREQIKTYLTKWGGVINSVAANEVVFTVRLGQMVKASGFWRVDLLTAVIIVVGYNPTTGIGTVDIDYSTTNWEAKNINQQIISRGGTIISHDLDNKVARFDIGRNALLTQFKKDIKEKMAHIYCRRQYYLLGSDVDAVIAAGGVVTLTSQQVLNKIQNKRDE